MSNRSQNLAVDMPACVRITSMSSKGPTGLRRLAPKPGSRPQPRQSLRRAALAFAREVERRLPDDVTTAWWRRNRDPGTVFVDYNQNARDHTIAAAYSVRGNQLGTVSTPVTWGEIDHLDPRDLTISTVPNRFASLGDLHAGIDRAVFDIAPLLEWADRDEAQRRADATRP